MIIQEFEAVYSVSKMARYTGVTRQSYWRWKRRQPTRLEMEDEVLKALVLKDLPGQIISDLQHQLILCH